MNPNQIKNDNSSPSIPVESKKINFTISQAKKASKYLKDNNKQVNSSCCLPIFNKSNKVVPSTKEDNNNELNPYDNNIKFHDAQPKIPDNPIIRTVSSILGCCLGRNRKQSV